MNYLEFLNTIINDGIEAAKNGYTKPKDSHKLKGSIAGLEACRGKNPEELLILFETESKKASENMYEYHKYQTQELLEEYWYQRCFKAEIEWVCNCVSCLMIAQGLNPIISCTARGMMKTAKVVGVKGE
jgi:hypothetical protein